MVRSDATLQLQVQIVIWEVVYKTAPTQLDSKLCWEGLQSVV